MTILQTHDLTIAERPAKDMVEYLKRIGCEDELYSSPANYIMWFMAFCNLRLPIHTRNVTFTAPPTNYQLL